MGSTPRYYWPDGTLICIDAELGSAVAEPRRRKLSALRAFVDGRRSMTQAADSYGLGRRTLKRFIDSETGAGWLPRPTRSYQAMHYVIKGDHAGARKCLVEQHGFAGLAWHLENAAFAAYTEQVHIGDWARQVFAALRTGESQPDVEAAWALLLADEDSRLRNPVADQLNGILRSCLLGHAPVGDVFSQALAYDAYDLGLDQNLTSGCNIVDWSDHEGTLADAWAADDISSVPLSACAVRSDAFVRAELRRQSHARRRSPPSCRAYIAVLTWLWKQETDGRVPPLTDEIIILLAFLRRLPFGNQLEPQSPPNERYREAIARERQLVEGMLRDISVVRPETVFIHRLRSCALDANQRVVDYLQKPERMVPRMRCTAPLVRLAWVALRAPSERASSPSRRVLVHRTAVVFRRRWAHERR